MKTKLSALFNSLFARVALFLLLGLLLAQIGSFWLFWGERDNAVNQARGEAVISRIVNAARAMNAEEPEKRASLIAKLQSEELEISLINDNEVMETNNRAPFIVAIQNRLSGNFEVRSARGMNNMNGMNGMRGNGRRQMGEQNDPSVQNRNNAHLEGRMRAFEAQHQPMLLLHIRLEDGAWMRVAASTEIKALFLPASLFWQMGATLFIVLAVTLFAVRQATRPLDKLVEAADQLGRNLSAPPLSEKGSNDMRRAALAFNQMQSRLKNLIIERTRALAAVSHDLRTPLTRLRLRTEMIEEINLREQMAHDIENMAQMLDSTLNYLRGQEDSEVLQAIDMNALLETMIAQSALSGHPIRLEGRAITPFIGKHLALKPALKNLMDNANKYGKDVFILLEDNEKSLQMSVCDSGNGVPEEFLHRLIEPYFRPDSSRALETGGAGLGLSIVNEIALLHGGKLTLKNRQEGGFCATLFLPKNSLCGKT